MSGQRKFEATITTRYGLPEKDIYEQVIDLVKKENIAKSRAQLLLVRRGLYHTHNPEPLVEEKVVYKDTPKQDRHLQPPEGIQEHIGGSDTGQRPSAGTLTTRDKADPPSHTALEEEKPANSLAWVGWLGVGIAAIAGLAWWFTKGLPPR